VLIDQEFTLEECGLDDMKDELKDVWKALKGK
jgi:hypothetical protein